MKKISKSKIFLALALCTLGAMFSACSSTGTSSQKEGTANMDSLYYPLDSIQANGSPVHVATSEDGNMKFYSWNTGEGGTCPDFGILCQFRTDDGGSKVIDASNHDGIGWVSRVHSIQKEDGSTYYLVVSFHQASSNDGYAWVSAFAIDGDSIKQVHVIDASPLQDQDENDFDVNYCISAWYDATRGEGYDWIHEYDTHSHDLYVPQTIDASPFPEISDWYRVYQFNGKRFEDKGIKAHKGLHQSLCDYDHLERFFRTKWHIVRIDRMKDGTLRYASWKASSSISDKPELVILGGKQNEDTYIFVNEGVTYEAFYQETERRANGFTHVTEYLRILKNGKVIDKQKILYPDE